MADEKKLNLSHEELIKRLYEAEETLQAIRSGQVDALIVKDIKGEQVYSLISPDHPYQVFFENMDESAIILSQEQIILYGNRSFFELIGASSENAIGTSILDIIPEDNRIYFTNSLQKEKKKKSELIIRTKRGEIRTVLVSFFNGIWNEAEQLCLLFRDITELKRAQQYIRISESISKILSEAPQLSQACKSIIQILHESLGWEVMITWLWNKEKQNFQCVDFVHIEGLEIAKFEKKTRESEAKSKLLFSYASASNRPAWEKDITEDSTFIRRNEAIETGLRGALAFSFNQNSELAGFIELFRRTPFTEHIDNLLLDLISSFGISAGLYINRLYSNQAKFQFSKALEMSLNSIYSVSANGLIISWLPGAEKTYGWTAEEMVGNSIKRLYPNDSKNEFDQMSQAVISGKSVENFESRRLRSDGQQICVTSSYDAIRDFFGKISEIIVVEQDITNQKNSTELLLESNKRFDSFIEITEDWIWELDKNGTFIFSNLAIYPILGYQVDEILEKNLLYFVPQEDRNRIEYELKDHAAKKEGWRHLTLSLLHKNGSLRWIETNAKVLLDPKNELLGFRGSSRNITESKNLEKIKNEFISIMSHELRTPLTSIYGGLTLLLSKDLPFQERQELLTNAHRNCIRLTNLINDTMDFEKLQLGKLKFDFKKIHLEDVILESIKSSEIIAHKFNVKIVTEGVLKPVVVNGDFSRLVQVMVNLLSNAIKFSPHDGTVRVLMEIKDDKARVSVIDKGPGIPKEFQPKLFDSFAQADSSDHRVAGGTGLGLYISKSIIDAHGGEIQYKTKLGEGTTFFFDIPLLTKDE